MFASVPVPVRLTVRLVLFGASDGIFKVPLFALVDVGEKVTCTVQLAPPARVVLHVVLVMENWFECVPEIEGVPKVRVWPPVLFIVNVWAEEALTTTLL